MITLFLDMDGVLCDFHSAYFANDAGLPDRERFTRAVFHHKIFENLKIMPDAQQLLDFARSLDGVNVEILTSVGTFNKDQMEETKKQKSSWLLKHNIHYKTNFTRNKQEKSLYATENSILIDDSEGCVNPFIAAGGHAILHTSTKKTLVCLSHKLKLMDVVVNE